MTKTNTVTLVNLITILFPVRAILKGIGRQGQARGYWTKIQN